eukprot:TRINITY_DN181246_c0_g1_i1.p1 TRINITY_DN181246_c0_g1~~TRINITY_DN181246_c0_g1_i1.p1  ORF type:complete len:468 (-),score=108.41 TRINITY_DN181246_c0_g1_i1:242-1645(-)
MPIDQKPLLEKSEAPVKVAVYSAAVCVVYILNITLGTGPITLPYGFQKCGLILSAIFMVAICATAFITATFLVEAMAVCTGIKKGVEQITEGPVQSLDVLEDKEDDEAKSLQRFEIGTMGEILFGKHGRLATFLIMIIYTIGTLSVYAVAVPKALASMTNGDILGMDSYYFYVGVFACIAIPFSFGNFQNTKPLQLVTIVVRFASFALMLYCAMYFIFDDKEGTNWEHIHKFEFSGLPWMTGNAIFSFMLHHSIPGLVSPIRPSRKIKPAIFVGYIIGVVLYIILCGSAMFAFGDIADPKCLDHNSEACKIQDMYNLNFASFHLQWVAKFLNVYPTMMVAIFPLIAITTRNNIAQLVGVDSSKLGEGGITKQQILFTFIATIPPIVVALCTKNVQAVSSITGGYAGLAIMFVIPAVMVTYARKYAKEHFGLDKHKFSSPFQSPIMVYTVCIFALIILCVNSYNFIAG